MNEVKQILVAAREHLTNPVNWGKGSHVCGNKECVVTAIYRQVYRLNIPDDVADTATALADAKARKEKNRLPYVGDMRQAARFNDHPDTTHADVLRFMDELIEEVR